MTTFRETYGWMCRALGAERKLAHVEKLVDQWAEQSVVLKPSSGTPTQNGIDANLAYCARELRDVLSHHELQIDEAGVADLYESLQQMRRGEGTVLHPRPAEEDQ